MLDDKEHMSKLNLCKFITLFGNYVLRRSSYILLRVQGKTKWYSSTTSFRQNLQRLCLGTLLWRPLSMSRGHQFLSVLAHCGCHDLPKRTYENTETDFYGYRNEPEWTSVGTETDRNRLQLIPKRTSMGTRKGRVGYDRNDPNKVMYVLVGR